MNATPVTGECVWTGAQLGGKETICFDLESRHLAAIEADLRSVRRRGLETVSIEKSDFALASIADEIQALSNELQHGRGLLVVRGFPVDCYSITDLETIYWGFGRHFGTPVSQSVMGDRLGHVIDVTDTDPHARAYRNRSELTLHTDFSDIVSFQCVRKAKSGGISWFASALAIHNQILETRPDLLDVLYRGFYWHRFREEGTDSAPVTPWRVPVFSNCQGKVSCRFITGYMHEAAAHNNGETLSQLQVEALNYFDQVAHENGMPIHFTLEPGDTVFVNNFTVLHARTAFENDPDLTKKRLLLRLWMTVPDGRPVVPEIQIYDSGREGGVPPQPGKTPSYDPTIPFEDKHLSRLERDPLTKPGEYFETR